MTPLLAISATHAYIAIGVVGALLIFFVILAGMFAASWFSQKNKRLGDLRERLGEDADHWRALSVPHLPDAIRHALAHKLAEAKIELLKLRDIWRNPGQRAAMEQGIRDSLIDIASKNDEQWRAVMVKVARCNAARNFDKQGKEAADAAGATVAATLAPPSPITVHLHQAPAASADPSIPASGPVPPATPAAVVVPVAAKPVAAPVPAAAAA